MKKLSRILSIAIALCMVLSLGCVSFAADDTSAYHEYLHEWLLAELEVNSSMTLEQVEDEFMPLINADDYVSFPAEMLFNGMLNNGCPMRNGRLPTAAPPLPPLLPAKPPLSPRPKAAIPRPPIMPTWPTWSPPSMLI